MPTFHPYFLLCVLSLSIPLSEVQASYAPKKFYLVDSLKLETLVSSDRRILDSCLNIYHSAKEDIIKITALGHICEHMMDKSWHKFLFVQLKHIEMTSTKNPDLTIQKARALNNLSGYYHEIGDVIKTLNYLDESQKIYKEIGDKKGEAETLSNMGVIYRGTSKVLKAMEYSNKSLDIYKSIHDKLGMARCYLNLGQTFEKHGDLTHALINYHKGLTLSKEINNKWTQAESLNNIALIHKLQNNLDKAFEFYCKSLSFSKEIGDTEGQAKTLSNLSGLFHSRKEYKKAIDYALQSLAIKEQLNSNLGIATVYNNLGTIYRDLKDTSEALKHFVNSKDIYELIDNKEGKSIVYYNIGSLYFDQNKFDGALNQGLASLRLAQEIGFPTCIMKSSDLLYHVYEELGKLDSAFRMFKLYSLMKDSLDNAQIQKRILAIENGHLLNEKNRQIDLLNKEKELKDVHFKSMVLLYSIIVITIFIAGLWFYNRKKTSYEKELITLRSLMSEMEQVNSNECIKNIPITIGDRMVLVELESILFFHAKNKYVFLNNKDGKSYIVDFTIKSLEKSLPRNFARIHRSFIINKERIEEIKKTHKGKFAFTLKGDIKTKVPSSVSYLQEVRKIMEEYKNRISIT